MPDNIEKTIYKLDLDGSGYINGVDKLSASTTKFTAEQERANRVLKQNEEALKSATEFLNQSKKDLDSYTGTNEKYRQQLARTFQSAQKDQEKLTALVSDNRKQYEQATAAAQEFASIAGKATGIQPPGGGKVIPPPLTPGAGITAQISQVINTEDFVNQARIIEQTKAEFDDLRVSITLAEQRMKQLNETDEEFKALAPIVEKGREALENYDKATQGAAESQGTLKSQILRGREELVKLQAAGQGASKQYQDLELHVAKLTDEFEDQQARIRTLSSDTKLLDFGKSAITAATSAFSIYTSVSILAGDESEDLQKKTMQLFAAMQLLQGLEQLSNLTRREGQLATLAQAGAQTIYTAVVGASTGALKAFRLALVGTGIGAAIVLIGYLVKKYLDYKDAVKEASDKQKVLSDIIKEGNKEAGKELTNAKLLYQGATDLNLTMNERLKAVRGLKQEFPEYFKNIKDETILNGGAKDSYDKLTASIIATARATAAKGKLTENEGKILDLDQQLQENADQAYRDRADNNLKTRKFLSQETDKTLRANALREQQEADREANQRQKDKDRDIIFKKEQLQRQNEQIIKLAGLDKLVDVTAPKPPPEKKDKTAKKAIEDDFKEREAALKEAIAALNASEFETEVNIRKVYAEKLKKAILDINKDKGLKPGETKQLITLTTELNTGELDKALGDFRKKQTDAREKLNEELLHLQEKNTQDQINLLQDEFDRRSRIIEFSENKELEQAKINTQKRIDTLDLDKLLLGEAAYQDAKNRIINAGEQEAINIQEKFAQQRKDLSADIFKELLNSYTDAVGAADLIITQDEATAIKAASEKFLAGKISYEKFQKEVDKIKKSHERDRLLGTLQVDKDELAEIDRQLAKIEDKYSKHYKELKRIRDQIAAKIAQEEVKVAEDNAQDPGKETGFQRAQKYIEATAQLADAVVGFWQQANEAESKALDRSIALQEKRVDQAQKIALRGNAQYLKAEEDRLRELNLKRENAARKQLGIDAALQASQVLVAITGAISRVGAHSFGAETIADIAIIVGALATGYGIVKSLQGNQPKLAEGTPYVSRGTNPRGRDTIPAWLDEGEAVTSAEKNRQYHPTIRAIHDGRIPADDLNDYVKNYHRIKAIPRPNYEKIKEVGELKVGQDGKMSVLLSEHSNLLRENNDLQRQILKKSIHVEQKIDRDGVASMVTDYQEQIKRNRKV